MTTRQPHPHPEQPTQWSLVTPRIDANPDADPQLDLNRPAARRPT